jgi:hypothetical protein
MRELEARDLQLLTRIREAPAPRVRTSAGSALQRVERVMGDRVAGILDALGVESRITEDLVAGLFLTLFYGLAASWDEPPLEPRQLVETLWLSVLSMAE